MSNNSKINKKMHISAKKALETSTAMLKSRELASTMRQTSDPLGSYTGTPSDSGSDVPVQDADDL